MSLDQINPRFLNTTLTLQRRTNTTDSVGDFTSVWNDIASIAGTVQPVSVKETKLAQGKEYTVDKVGFIQKPSSLVFTPVPGDRVLDTEDSALYDVVGVKDYVASNVNVTIGHHYKLLLQIARANKS